jgi:hypothetical protein
MTVVVVANDDEAALEESESPEQAESSASDVAAIKPRNAAVRCIAVVSFSPDPVVRSA